MTVDTTSSGGTVAEFEETGLEDFAPTDIVIPRLKILHKEGKFHDNLSGNDYEKLNVVFLGLVKQRILWHPALGQDDKPMCKSPDFNHGFPIQPEQAEKQPREKFFPWKLAAIPNGPAKGLNEANYPQDDQGRQVVDCIDCPLKEWGTHPVNTKNPYCAEQYTMPLMFEADDGNLVPALVTFAKTGVKSTKQYISDYARSKTPLYTAFTELGLIVQTKGTNVFSTPTFKKSGPTDRTRWSEFAKNYTSIRMFITAWPTSRDDEDEGTVTVESNDWNAPEAPPQSATTPPPAAPPAAPPVAAAAPPAPPAAPPVPPTPQPAATPEPEPAASDGGYDPNVLPF